MYLIDIWMHPNQSLDTSFNLPNHSKQQMAVCSLSLHLGSSESRKTLEQKFIFQIGTLNPHGINECISFNCFLVTIFPPMA